MTNKKYLNKLIKGNCLKVLPKLDEHSVDLVVADLPYGTTPISWDKTIPASIMWKQLDRVIKPTATVLLFARQPFTTKLIQSNESEFKYAIVWVKTKAANFHQSKNMPLLLHEDICIFSKAVIGHKEQTSNRMTYNPIGVKQVNREWKRPQIYDSDFKYRRPSHKTRRIINAENYPSSILFFNSVHNPPHPTQKPLDLLEYLIKTYSNESNTILDFCCGSGTAGVACVGLNRNYILIEKEAKYCKIAQHRLNQAIRKSNTLNKQKLW